MSELPFLPLDEQESFLKVHKMIEDAHLSSDDLHWLSTVNFHYVMGFARHYRNLIDEGLWPGPKRFEEIRGLVQAEEELMILLTPWIRRAESHLRALAVRHYCLEQMHGEGYLDYSRWISGEYRSQKLQLKMLQDIQRHREPYVTGHIDGKVSELNVEKPDRCSSHNKDLWLDLVDGLPLWSVIDSFSVGTLGKFIQNCGCQPQGTEAVKKLIAQELNVPNSRINKLVESFGITRNLIFHHQRLWMRPMPKSPGMPNDLVDRYEEYDFRTEFKEAHFVALASISKLLPAEDREHYLNLLSAFVNARSLFALGIMNPPFLRFEEAPNSNENQAE